VGVGTLTGLESRSSADKELWLLPATGTRACVPESNDHNEKIIKITEMGGGRLIISFSPYI
jgi:hypothetical protein